jgi:hypothetical protein
VVVRRFARTVGDGVGDVERNKTDATPIGSGPAIPPILVIVVSNDRSGCPSFIFYFRAAYRLLL